MLLATPLSKLRLLLYSLLISLSLIGSVSAMTDRVIEASSLYTCMSNSKLSADRFNVAFTPINSTITYTVNITAEISGYVQAYVDVYAYGFKIISEHVDPCSLDAGGLCPVYPGSNYLSSTYHISSSVVSEIPGIAYTFPDIDAIVVVKVKDDTNTVIACIEAELSNRKSVNHIAVKWVTAIIAGIGMLTSAIISTMGSTYTAAHIAANSVSLCLLSVRRHHLHAGSRAYASYCFFLGSKPCLVRWTYSCHFYAKDFPLVCGRHRWHPNSVYFVSNNLHSHSKA